MENDLKQTLEALKGVHDPEAIAEILAVLRDNCMRVGNTKSIMTGMAIADAVLQVNLISTTGRRKS